MSGVAVRRVGRLSLESGETLRDVRVAYRLEGSLSPSRDNVVVVFHSLTGSPADLGGWEPLAGAGAPLDTSRFAVVCPNLLGSCYGTTYRRERGAPGRSPAIGPRDQARLVKLLLDGLGVRRVALAVGGSLGGMVALEWAATFPGFSDAVISFAAPAGPCAWGAAWNHVHRRAIEAGGRAGLAVARMVGMLTYRTPVEAEARFRRDTGEHPVRSYLDHHGGKLVRRFTKRSYLALLDAMDAHDVGRGRGGIGAALAAFEGELTGVGIPGDLLYPPEEVKRWTGVSGAAYREIASDHGHDAFLLETDAVGALLSAALERQRDERPSRGCPREGPPGLLGGGAAEPRSARAAAGALWP